MIHFNNTTGKNKGKLQLTKLANYVGGTEGTLRLMKKNDEEKERKVKLLEIMHLGALCHINKITENDLKKYCVAEE
jgi:hypothetical protein